jgi:hypothetical protein
MSPRCCIDPVSILNRSASLRPLGCAAALLLSACVTHEPAPPPLLDLSTRDCPQQFDLATPQFLALEGDGNTITRTIDNSAPCIQLADGSKSLYEVLQLPDSTGSYMVSVDSAPVGQGIFSPRVAFLDAAGTMLREVPRENFLFHGASLHAGARVHAGERFLVVASDPHTAGGTVSQIVGSTQANTVSTGMVMFTTHTGKETASTYTYAHGGRVTVEAKPIPGEEKKRQ